MQTLLTNDFRTLHRIVAIRCKLKTSGIGRSKLPTPSTFNRLHTNSPWRNSGERWHRGFSPPLESLAIMIIMRLMRYAKLLPSYKIVAWVGNDGFNVHVSPFSLDIRISCDLTHVKVRLTFQLRLYAPGKKNVIQNCANGKDLHLA